MHLIRLIHMHTHVSLSGYVAWLYMIHWPESNHLTTHYTLKSSSYIIHLVYFMHGGSIQNRQPEHGDFHVSGNAMQCK